MTDCIHCGQNPGEVCRGCHERTRQEAYAWADERLNLEYQRATRLVIEVGELSERAVLAEQERDRLRQEVQPPPSPAPLRVQPTSDLHRCAMFAEILSVGAVQWIWYSKSAIELTLPSVRALCESHERLRLDLRQRVGDLSERAVLAEQERDRLREEISRLRQALMPFARLAASTPYYRPSDTVPIYVSDLRAAAKALEDTTP